MAGNDNGAAPSPVPPQPVPVFQLVITLDPSNGQASVNGPIENPELFGQMIGAAVMAVIKHNAHKPQGGLVLLPPGARLPPEPHRT